MIKNIVFDMGEVLLPVTRQRCLDEFEALGFSNISASVGTCYKDGLFQQLELGNIEENRFVEEVLTHCHPGTTPDRIIDVWNDFIAPIPRKRLDMLWHLKSKYRLFLLSNTNIIHWKHVCKCDFSYNGRSVDDYFEMKFLSFELHVTKPDVEIFEIMLKQTGISADESLFIDDAKKNCEIAETLGIHAFNSVDDDWMNLLMRN